MIKVATVYGGSGFLGRSIVQRLARAGYQVRVAVRRPSRAASLKTAGQVGQIQPMVCNITDPDSVRRAAMGAQVLVNLTGILFEKGTQTFDRVHAGGAALVAAAGRSEGARRVIHVSAIGADLRSPSKYAQSKAAGEEALFDRFPAATVLRPSIIFGPDDDFFNQFARMAQLSPVLPLIGGGQTRFQPVFVGDVADAALAALADPDSQGQVYELGGPEILTFRQCLTRLLEEIDRKRLLLPLPFALATGIGRVAALLPKPPITPDQVRLLQQDNVVSEDARTLGDLGLTATPLAAVLPRYLSAYRVGGQFSAAR